MPIGGQGGLFFGTCSRKRQKTKDKRPPPAAAKDKRQKAGSGLLAPGNRQPDETTKTKDIGAHQRLAAQENFPDGRAATAVGPLVLRFSIQQSLAHQTTSGQNKTGATDWGQEHKKS